MVIYTDYLFVHRGYDLRHDSDSDGGRVES